jgi:hypothetical protein
MKNCISLQQFNGTIFEKDNCHFSVWIFHEKGCMHKFSDNLNGNYKDSFSKDDRMCRG